MDIELAKTELRHIKEDNENKSMRLNTNTSDIRIRWSEKDYKEIAEIQQRCARENKAIETVLAELETVTKQRNDLAFDISEKQDELDERNKIIENMAEVIEECRQNDCIESEEIDLSQIAGTEKIIEYFEKKVGEE